MEPTSSDIAKWQQRRLVEEFCAAPPPGTRLIYDERGNVERIEVPPILEDKNAEKR